MTFIKRAHTLLLGGLLSAAVSLTAHRVKPVMKTG